jgi:anti-sigma28 factor (negative regulator of flagellin synthesis)
MKIEGFGVNPIYLDNNKIKNEKKKKTQNIEQEYKLEVSLDYQIEDKDYQARLEKITKAIKNGSYSIDLNKLAKALIKEVFGK